MSNACTHNASLRHVNSDRDYRCAECRELAALRAFRDEVRALCANVTDEAQLPYDIRDRLARLDSAKEDAT